MITLSNLSKSYDSNLVLKNIQLTFQSGKVYGIVGENGAGKTTLFKCIAGLENYAGTIESDLIPLKNHLGLLLTEPFYFDRITGREYLQLMCNARMVELKQVDAKNIFDLPLDQYASTYSTGMKKKLALLGILVQNNQYYIFDEPYNGVDIHSNILITEIILKLKQLGKTVLVSSHIFSTLRDTCDEIILLKNGEIAQQVDADSFDLVENEMKKTMIGNKIEQLELK